MKLQDRTRQALGIFATILIVAVATASSAEVVKDLPANHKKSVADASAARLAMEARGDDRDGGVDLNALEGKSASSSSPIYADGDDKPAKPMILGATSKVAIVYSERKPSIQSTSPTEDRSWRVVKAAPRDSYLDALTHSHSSKDPREGIVRLDATPKVSKLIRREYSEGPVYRPAGETYGASKESSSLYASPNDVNRGASKNIARISYGGPTPEPFLPTPSDAYSLPVQSSVNFNNHNNHGSYVPATQVSYGAAHHAPAPDTSYGVPSHVYGPAARPQNSYGPPIHHQAQGYPPAGPPQQVYGPPAPAYGAPYANQDYSQHLPSLSSVMSFGWPLALKLNAFTIAKILLKLVIFKMIVKFIAVICLLLFIPKLELLKKDDKDDNDNDNDDGRRLVASDSTLERLNILTALVTSSIEKYEKETNKSASSADDCTTFGCRMRKFITFDQSWNDYTRLFESYVAEETDKDGNPGTQTNRIET